MHDSDPQPLETLLSPPCLAPGEAVPCPALLGRTLSSLRWQRRWRKLGAVAVLAGCYVAGLVTVLAWTPPGPVSFSHTSEPPRTGGLTPRRSPAAPRDLELLALKHPWQAGTLYRAAGDRYLEIADPGGAVRCYGNSLDEGTDLNITLGDSWLLMAIKQARQKEMDECDR